VEVSIDEALGPTLGLFERLIAEASIDGSDTIGRCLDHHPRRILLAGHTRPVRRSAPAALSSTAQW
jgi:hypothetical protein